MRTPHLSDLRRESSAPPVRRFLSILKPPPLPDSPARRTAIFFGCFLFSLPVFLTFHNAVRADTDPSRVEIIFLAGPKDHGAPGRHEYEKDLRVLAESIERSGNVQNVTTRVFVGEAPRDLRIYENAAAIVINSSSDRSDRELHPLFPPNPTTSGTGYGGETAEFLQGLNELIIRNNIGVAVFHYSLWVENWRARGYYMDWLGGLWVQMGSGNPVATWDMELIDQTHPVLNGVQPWEYRDEMFSRFFFPDNIPGRTKLIMADPEESMAGRGRLPPNYGPQVAAWVFERPDGGRGFAFGGMDFHDNMEIEDYRRFLLNGILWVAGMEVPPEGVQSPAPVISTVDESRPAP